MAKKAPMVTAFAKAQVLRQDAQDVLHAALIEAGWAVAAAAQARTLYSKSFPPDRLYKNEPLDQAAMIELTEQTRKDQP